MHNDGVFEPTILLGEQTPGKVSPDLSRALTPTQPTKELANINK